MKYLRGLVDTVKSVAGRWARTTITFTDEEIIARIGENSPAPHYLSAKSVTLTDTATKREILRLNFPYEAWYWETRNLVKGL